MIAAPIPQNEAARLETLRQYQVLDTDSEDVFDDLTRLASYICGTPTALISLVDANRQWFKARVGIQARETRAMSRFAATPFWPEIASSSKTHSLTSVLPIIRSWLTH